MKSIALCSAVLVIAASLLAPAAEPPVSTQPQIPLRHLSGIQALLAVHAGMEPAAADAIASMDLKGNVLTLDEHHPLAGKVREFLAKMDRPPQQVRVTGKITRHVDATAGAPAHDEVSYPTMLGLMDRSMTLDIPTEHGSTKLEFRVSLQQATSKP